MFGPKEVENKGMLCLGHHQCYPLFRSFNHWIEVFIECLPFVRPGARFWMYNMNKNKQDSYLCGAYNFLGELDINEINT